MSETKEMKEHELVERLRKGVNEALTRYSKDLREHSAELATRLDRAPEVRRYLEAVGVCNIRDLSPKQMCELRDVLFRVMNRRVHLGAD